MEKTVEKTVEKTREKTRKKTRKKTRGGGILRLMKKKPQITTRELGKMLGLSSSGIEWQIAKLKREDRLKRIGGAKGGHLEVVV